MNDSQYFPENNPEKPIPVTSLLANTISSMPKHHTAAIDVDAQSPHWMVSAFAWSARLWLEHRWD